MAELQPRVRGLLESRLGRAHADTLIGVSNAVVHALTRGEAPLALDALQRVLQLAEIRGRAGRMAAPGTGVGGGRRWAPGALASAHPRPAPLPSGPVENCVDRTSLASLSGAGGLLAWTRDLEQSAKALLATVPKAAAMGREAFAARLGDVLARDGVVPMDGTALRLLDRVSAVLIDSRVLCAASRGCCRSPPWAIWGRPRRGARRSPSWTAAHCGSCPVRGPGRAARGGWSGPPGSPRRPRRARWP
ncbi:hypothetical protein ACFQ10_44945 [Streptomyces indonesiensis]